MTEDVFARCVLTLHPVPLGDGTQHCSHCNTSLFVHTWECLTRDCPLRFIPWEIDTWRAAGVPLAWVTPSFMDLFLRRPRETRLAPLKLMDQYEPEEVWTAQDRFVEGDALVWFIGLMRQLGGTMTVADLAPSVSDFETIREKYVGMEPGL